MAINRTKLKRLQKLIDQAERLSADICKSRGLKGKLESDCYQMHTAILKASAKLQELSDGADRRALLKRKQFDVEKLNLDNLKGDE